MVFKRNHDKLRKWHVEQAVALYLQWLSDGHPASSWSYAEGTHTFVGKNMIGAAQGEGVPLTDRDIDVAKAKGKQSRYDRLMALLSSDDKNIAVKLGILKHVREEFFGEDEQQEAQHSILSRALDKVLQYEAKQKEISNA